MTAPRGSKSLMASRKRMTSPEPVPQLQPVGPQWRDLLAALAHDPGLLGRIVDELARAGYAPADFDSGKRGARAAVAELIASAQWDLRRLGRSDVVLAKLRRRLDAEMTPRFSDAAEVTSRMAAGMSGYRNPGSSHG